MEPVIPSITNLQCFLASYPEFMQLKKLVWNIPGYEGAYRSFERYIFVRTIIHHGTHYCVCARMHFDNILAALNRSLKTLYKFSY